MSFYKQKGVAAVELALVMVPLLVLCFGLIEVGRALYYYNGLVKATRGAARYLTVKDLGSLTSATSYGSGSTNPDVKAAIALAWCGMTTCASDATGLVPGLLASNVTVMTSNNVHATNDGSTSVGVVSLVTVTISGVQFTSFLPYSIASFPFSPVKITMAWSVT